MDGGAEGVQHLHLLEDVFAAGGADDQQLTTLREEETRPQTLQHFIWNEDRKDAGRGKFGLIRYRVNGDSGVWVFIRVV